MVDEFNHHGNGEKADRHTHTQEGNTSSLVTNKEKAAGADHCSLCETRLTIRPVYVVLCFVLALFSSPSHPWIVLNRFVCHLFTVDQLDCATK